MIADKNASKGISLFIKGAIFIASVYYIFYKINDIKGIINVNLLFNQLQWRYFLYALWLVAVNWGIEAVKWRYMIKKIESVSFSIAFKSVLAGVSISIFTPNRVGEFAGKIFFLKTTEKVKATIISVIGSAVQLFVTILAALLAAILYYKLNNNVFLLSEYISFKEAISCAILFMFVGVMIMLYYMKKDAFKEYLVVYSKHEFIRVFILSALRYIVFSIQYYLILLAFGIGHNMLNSLLLIAFVFFVNTVVPTFALTEIAVRTASGVFFLSTVTNDINAVVAASLILWVINLALPALTGLIFIWQLRFFNE
jgi:uncharacterized membrane protein YbhN (UPF0104 family)